MEWLKEEMTATRGIARTEFKKQMIETKRGSRGEMKDKIGRRRSRERLTEGRREAMTTERRSI